MEYGAIWHWRLYRENVGHGKKRWQSLAYGVVVKIGYQIYRSQKMNGPFVVLRYNGTKVRAYVNGTWDETTLNGFNTQISDLFIGGESTNNGSSFRSYFTGDIDEVAVWNKALTNAEILALYNNGSGRDAATNGVAIALKQTSKATGNLMKEVAQPFLMQVEMVKMEQGTEQAGDWQSHSTTTWSTHI